MDELLEQLTALHSKSTQAEWNFKRVDHAPDDYTELDENYNLVIGDYAVNDMRYYPSAPKPEDAEFAAALVNAWPRIRAALSR